MTIEMKLPSGDEATVTERLFDVLTTARELTAPDGDAGAGAVSFGRLYGYATEPDAEDAELERRLETDPGLAAKFRWILRRTARFSMPRAAAASTGAVNQRTGEGWRLRISPSEAEPTQAIVVIEFDDRDEPGARWLIACYEGDQYQRFALPTARGGIIQILEEIEAPLVQALQDPSTEVFLR